ncbi:MAG: response regulator [Scytolyngbya sp. HA4215-MV1]|jgi:DNA-binding response OmpR family regulator|nr:response regulator [Scytolyngbya sp. HA4215-MV1]
MKILLVEDDDVLIKVLTRSLTSHNYVVDTVKDGEMGWTYGSTFEYDLLVLDIVLPKLDGISLCKRFREQGYTMPILLLTAQDTRTVKVQGLDAGADDYVVKPFDQVELIARIRALMRRGSSNPFPLLSWGDLLLNPSTCEVNYNGQPLSLTTKEYELLELFLRDRQYVFSTDELIDRLWSSEEFPSEATVRSHIRRVRKKLADVGAPPDFIATLHGRGYYLKTMDADMGDAFTATSAFVSEEGTPTAALVNLSTVAQFQTKENSPVDSQQQYLDFLNETWATTKPKSLEQTSILLEVVHSLQDDRLSSNQQVEAQRIAHTLAGTLGIFGLSKATHLARQLEHWLAGYEPLRPEQIPLLKTLAMALQQAIQNTTTIEQSPLFDEQSPLLLLVSDDSSFNQALIMVATRCSIRVEVVSALELAPEWAEAQPQVILLRLPTGLTPTKIAEPASASHWLSALQVISHHYPSLPILVMGDRDELDDRLEVVRWGGKLFLEALMPAEQVITTVVNLLGAKTYAPKVMIVDDDHTWLSTLPSLLKPWGFKVTTLADPKQFWTVLQSVTPDVLVLDVNMPQINGFELCQILRGDPDWQQLPVLFLSVLTDAASQHQAFTVGADDYLCKPVVGGALANRILSRLHRIRACAS